MLYTRFEALACTCDDTNKKALTKLARTTAVLATVNWLIAQNNQLMLSRPQITSTPLKADKRVKFPSRRDLTCLLVSWTTPTKEISCCPKKKYQESLDPLSISVSLITLNHSH